jgi:hypothetical protein
LARLPAFLSIISNCYELVQQESMKGRKYWKTLNSRVFVVDWCIHSFAIPKVSSIFSESGPRPRLAEWR